MSDDFEPIPTAVRVYTTRTRHNRATTKPNPTKRRPPHEVLVFDTETTIDPPQRLLVGVWRFYRDDPDGQRGVTCLEEGIFYPDHLPVTDPDGYQRLVEYAAAHRPAVAPGFSPGDTAGAMPVWPVSRWLEERLYRYGYRHRDRCDLVGFNLPYDLTRLASYWAPGRNNFLGGWSFGLFGDLDQGDRWRDTKYHPRLSAKSIDPRRTLFAWGSIKDDPDPRLRGNRGRFVDLRTLTFALTDESHSLESACVAFGIPFTKDPVEYGVISERLLDYARDDVGATARLYRACLDELDRHPGVELPAHRLYSPATVGTHYLEAMGLQEPTRHFGLDPQIHGWAMSAFYGGRAEARIVRTPVPIAYVDATSMYPTVNALLDTWKLLAADNLEPVDATQEVRDLLADPDLYDKCFRREFWSESIGVTLVELDHPDGAVLPVRAEYDEAAPDPGIGLNPLRYQGTIWYTVPDVIASTILTGQAPPVSRAVRLLPEGTQPDLRPVQLRGGATIDPTSQDPFVAFIELRHRTKNDPTIPHEEKARLDQFLKITANATAYGVLARYDSRRFAKPKRVTVYGPDEPFQTSTVRPEDPGPYCFPPIAATITAAARLMLAMLERGVTDAGGTWAFCDTDSMGIVTSQDPTPIECATPDGSNRVIPLHPETVREILARFRALNPYDADVIPDLWKQEHGSLDQPVRAYVVSAKRYALYWQPDVGGPIELIDWTESGLGAYLNPLTEEQRDDGQDWIREAWGWILAGGDKDDLPDWAGAYALTRFTLSSPAIQPWFHGYNRRRPRSHQIRPASFGLLAHPDPLLPNPGAVRPAAPYTSQPDQWDRLPWYDRATGQRVTVTTTAPDDPDFISGLDQGKVRIRTLGDVVAAFRRRPEHKSLAPDGTPTTGDTRGLLRRRPVESAPVLTDLIGKEGNDLAERGVGLVDDHDGYRVNYGHRGDRWNALVLPVLRQLGAQEIMRRTGRGRSAVYEVLSGKPMKYGRPTERYVSAAIAHVTQQLEDRGHRFAGSRMGMLYRYRMSRRAQLVPSQAIAPANGHLSAAS